MKLGVYRFLWLFLGFAVYSHATAESETETLLKARQLDYFAALQDAELERLMPFYQADAVLQIAGMPPVSGRDDIRVFYQRMLAHLGSSQISDVTLRISESEDIAYSIGATTNSFQTPEGSREYQGKFLIIWTKASDKWKISVYTISSNQR